MENWEVEQGFDGGTPSEEGAAGQERDRIPEGPAPEPGAQSREAPFPGRELYLNVRVLVVMMTAFVMLFTFVARIIVVSGPSMENTLWGGLWATPRSRETWWCSPRRAIRRTPL